jgi:hypothetical protein
MRVGFFRLVVNGGDPDPAGQGQYLSSSATAVFGLEWTPQ